MIGARVTKPQTSPTLMIQFIDSMNAYQHSSPADRAKISLLDITVPLLPRGKKLRDCTGAENRRRGEFLTDLCALATTPEPTRVIQEIPEPTRGSEGPAVMTDLTRMDLKVL